MTIGDKRFSGLSMGHALLVAGALLSTPLMLRVLSPEFLSQEFARRTMGVLMGVVVVVYANAVPKALIPLARLRRNPIAEQALRRFTGWTLVLGGLAYMLIWAAAPLAYANALAASALGAALLLVVVRCLGIWPVRAALIALTMAAMPGATQLGTLGAQQAPSPSDSVWAGSWEGPLTLPGGQTLRVGVNLSRNSSGTWTATFDSRDQGATGIPTDSVRIVGDTLSLRVPSASGGFRGTLGPDGAITGRWSQGAGSLPLVLRRRTGPEENTRPQHPVAPFPYRSEDVRFSNGGAGIELAGTLTLPEGDGPFPAVALVSGSGPQDRDQTLFGHKTFLVIADHLTRNGIAVLRYDDRGVGQSGGDFSAATSIDFAGDAAAAVEFLKRHSRVNQAQVGLIGHSEGGLIAPLVVTGAEGAPSAELAFAVLLAPPAVPGEDILYMQGEAIARAAGATDSATAVNRRVQERMFAVIRAEADDARRQAAMRTLLGQIVSEMTPADRIAQGIQPGQDTAWIDRQVSQVGSPWFRTFLIYDPRPALERLTIPVLSLFGSLDLQVPARENRVALERALATAGNTRSTVQVVPGVNHLFQTARTGSPAEYGMIRETIAPAVLESMTRWIREQTGIR